MKKILLMLACACILVNSAQARAKSGELDTLMLYWYGTLQFNGSVMVAQHGKVLLDKGYGVREVNKGDACLPQTLYQIGEATEMFTATLVHMLAQQNKLSLDDNLKKYYDDYPDGDKITIRHLLTHTSGIYDYITDDSFSAVGFSMPRSRKEVLNTFKKKPLLFAPGTKYYESGSDYAMLAFIVEKVTGKKFHEAMYENITTPLDMKNTGFDFPGLASWDKAQGYAILNSYRMVPAFPQDSSVGFGYSGMYSTTGDMYKFAKGMLENKLLPAAVWQQMMAPVNSTYGQGWQTINIDGIKAVGHAGEIPGMLCSFSIIPQDSTIVILLANDSESEIERVQADITAVLYNKPYKYPAVKQMIEMKAPELKQYEGRYEMEEGGVDIHFYVKDDLLYGEMYGSQEFAILPEGDDKFFMGAMSVEFRFTRDANKKVNGVVARQNRKETKGRKWQ